MVEIVARCGFVCSQCPEYKDNIRSDVDKRRVVEKWLKYHDFRINAEEVVCDGGIKPDSENPKRITKDCPIRSCVLQKKIENCAYCGEYPCDLMEKRTADFEQIKEMPKNLISGEESVEFFRPYDSRINLEQIKAKLKSAPMPYFWFKRGRTASGTPLSFARSAPHHGGLLFCGNHPM